VAPDSRLKFSYYDLPRWARFWKYWPGGVYLYYLLWQFGAYRLARKLHAQEHFHVVQHVTFVSFRQPSFMGGLGIPFIFGPVGGGESMPKQFRGRLPLKARIKEWLRSAGNSLVVIDPLMRHVFSRAQTIACTTLETMNAIPREFRGKCIVQRAIGIEASQTKYSIEVERERELGASRPQFLFVGRLLYWKGLHLALRALAQVREAVPNVRLRVIGEGGDRRWLERVAERVQVSDLVEWIASRPHKDMWQEYRESACLVFPSLHDSGGMVVLEALAAGVPVVCLDLGGPGAIVTAACGYSVQTREVSEAEVVKRLALAMIALATDARLREGMSSEAFRRAQELTWGQAAEALYARARLLESSKSLSII
jgi:glycosyltransferase involved in cell wall biosynthesis